MVAPDGSSSTWLIWLAIVACLPPLGLNIMVTLDVALMQGLQLTPFQGHAAIALYVLGMAAGQPLAGISADQWGRRKTLIVGLLLGFIGGIAAASATSAVVLLLGRLFTGMGLSVVLVIPRATLRDLCSGRVLQRGMGIISLAFAITPCIAPVLGWWLLAWGGGWRVAMGLVPFLIGLGIVTAGFLHTETKPATTQKPGWNAFTSFWNLRIQRFTALAFAAISSVGFLLIAQGPAALRESVGIDGTFLSFVMGGTFLGFLAGNLIAVRRARRLDGTQLCVFGAVVAGLGVGVITLCIWWPSTSMWVVGMLIYSAGHGIIFPSALGVVMQAMPERAGMAAALTGMLQMILGALVSGCTVLLPGTATQRTAGVALLMVTVGALFLAAAIRKMPQSIGEYLPNK